MTRRSRHLWTPWMKASTDPALRGVKYRFCKAGIQDRCMKCVHSFGVEATARKWATLQHKREAR